VNSIKRIIVHSVCSREEKLSCDLAKLPLENLGISYTAPKILDLIFFWQKMKMSQPFIEKEKKRKQQLDFIWDLPFTFWSKSGTTKSKQLCKCQCFYGFLIIEYRFGREFIIGYVKIRLWCLFIIYGF
jgi:hypothetical protein